MESNEKKVLFLCGSPKGKSSASYEIAKYASLFLEDEHEFIFLSKMELNSDPDDPDADLRHIGEKILKADAIIPVFGVHSGFVPAKMQFLLSKFLAQGMQFKDKIISPIITSIGIIDDHCIDRLRYTSELLGAGFLEGISVMNDGFCRPEDIRKSAESVIFFIEMLKKALKEGYIPEKREYVSEAENNHSFDMKIATPERKDFSKKENKILVISGDGLYNWSVKEIVSNFSENTVMGIKVEEKNIGICTGCDYCLVKGECRIEDDIMYIHDEMKKAHGIIFVGRYFMGMLDNNIKKIIDRNKPLFMFPQLDDKYGFTVLTGEGSNSEDVALNLNYSLKSYGVRSLGVILEKKREEDFIEGLRTLVRDLDQCIREKDYNPPDRHDIRGGKLIKQKFFIKSILFFRKCFLYNEKKSEAGQKTNVFRQILAGIVYRNNWSRRQFIAARKSMALKKRKKILSKYKKIGITGN